MKFKCSGTLNKLIFFGNKFCTLQLIFNMFSMPYCEWAIFRICYKNRCFIREITFLQERFVYSTTHSFLCSINRQWWLLQNVEMTLWPVYDWFSRLIQLGKLKLFPMMHTQRLPSPALQENLLWRLWGMFSVILP